MSNKGGLVKPITELRTHQAAKSQVGDSQAIKPAKTGYKDSILLHKDSTILKTILPQSIDLIVTSPPYNLSKNYSGNEADDNLEYQDYLDFSRRWLSNAYTWIRDTGRLCLNIGLDKNKNGKRPVYADLVRVAMEVGWQYHTTIIWAENNISRRTAWG